MWWSEGQLGADQLPSFGQSDPGQPRRQVQLSTSSVNVVWMNNGVSVKCFGLLIYSIIVTAIVIIITFLKNLFKHCIGKRGEMQS